MTRRLTFRDGLKTKEETYEPSELELFAERFSRDYGFFLHAAAYEIDKLIGGYAIRKVAFRGLSKAILRDDNRIMQIIYGRAPSQPGDAANWDLGAQIQALVSAEPKKEFVEVRYSDGELMLIREPQGKIEVTVYDKCADVAYKKAVTGVNLEDRKNLHTRSYPFVELVQATIFVEWYFKTKFPRNPEHRVDTS